MSSNEEKVTVRDLCKDALQPLFESFDRTADLIAVDEFFDSFDVDDSWFYMKNAFKIAVTVKDLNIKNLCQEMKRKKMRRESVTRIREKLNDEFLFFLDIYDEIYEKNPRVSVMVLINLFVDKVKESN